MRGGGGDGLLLGGVGGGPPDVDGGVDGVLGFVGGDGQVALASITDVLVVVPTLAGWPRIYEK